MSEYILQTKGLSKIFGGLVALDKIDMEIEKGRISAIIGPNGAGKTTLFNLIAGVYSATSGEILFQGMRVNSMPAHRRASIGVARTFQHALLFGNMTVLENVMTGQHPRSQYGFLEAAFRLPKSYREERKISLEAIKYLNLVGLGMDKDKEALSLPLGRQKLLAIARALATEPKLLLLDEPGAGLTTLEKRALSDLIRRIIDMGITVLLVEHDMPLVMGLAEKIIVLDSGQKIAEGDANQIQKDERVIAVYLGEEVEG
ncbi:MAG: ABC transporter ATP-binding protein [Dehalococcoidales bacterium]|nr:ABC transporter ATP-binding protein [Dehalococcoidales bacterium]